MIEPEDICEPEWAEWYLMTLAQRWAETQKLWSIYLAMGGSLDPEPDTQSPFFDAATWEEARRAAMQSIPAGGQQVVRVVRRGGI